MNQSNILAGVEVPTVAGNFDMMFAMQYGLQERLKQLPPEPRDWQHAASKCVYWAHCVRAETVELIEWLDKRESEAWLKELQMEAIDIVHFVFNIGLEIGIQQIDIVAYELGYNHNQWTINVNRIKAAATLLSDNIVKLIDQLPWKTWKTYEGLKLDSDLIKMCYQQVFSACLLLCNACELDRQAIIDMYYAKNKVNHQRQDNGY